MQLTRSQFRFGDCVMAQVIALTYFERLMHGRQQASFKGHASLRLDSTNWLLILFQCVNLACKVYYDARSNLGYGLRTGWLRDVSFNDVAALEVLMVRALECNLTVDEAEVRKASLLIIAFARVLSKPHASAAKAPAKTELDIQEPDGSTTAPPRSKSVIGSRSSSSSSVANGSMSLQNEAASLRLPPPQSLLRDVGACMRAIFASHVWLDKVESTQRRRKQQFIEHTRAMVSARR